MAAVIIFVGLVPLSVSAATKCTCDEVPIIYLRGKTAIVPDKSKDQSSTNHSIPHVTGSELEKYIPELVTAYSVSMLFGNFDTFSRKLTEIFKEEYKDFALDGNGNITNNSGISHDLQWTSEPVKNNHKATTPVDSYLRASAEIYKYYYIYDCRVDPFETAADLRKYINKVKEVTGHSTVKILARCYGTNVVSAYFAKYGWDDVEDVVLYNPIMFGTDKLDCIFSGNIKVTQESIDYVSNNYLADSEEDVLIKMVVDAINLAGLFDFSNVTTSEMINYCAPEILRETYATCPGFWAMLSADVFEESKENIFKYYEDEFAGVIKKIDNYHNNVRLKIQDIYSAMKADGVDVYIIAKYGTQLLPIMENPQVQSDDTVAVETQSPGTFAAPLGKAFGDVYMAEAALRGATKYISPDRQIDVSKAFMRDTTWYIRDVPHDKFTKSFDIFIYRLLRAEKSVNVNTYKDYPQFLVYDVVNGEEMVTPLKATDTTAVTQTPAEDIQIFVDRIMARLMEMFQKVFSQAILDFMK